MTLKFSVFASACRSVSDESQLSRISVAHLKSVDWRSQIIAVIHEGFLEFVENGRISDCYGWLMNDLFLVLRANAGGRLKA